MKRFVLTAVIVLLASSQAFAQERIVNQGQPQQSNPSNLRVGLGVSVSQVDLRMEFDEKNALDLLFNFQVVADSNANLGRNNLVGAGLQFLHRLITEENVNFHLLGGLGYGYQGTTLPFPPLLQHSLSFFGGVGAEYFLTDSFSLESNVGLGLDFGFQEAAGGNTATAFTISPRSLTPGLFKLRYYF